MTNNVIIEKFKDEEPAWLESVKLSSGGDLPNSQLREGVSRALVKLRYERNPVVGDKFASRHGQKGVVGMFWPTEDMPFTESGVVPDILFNPHGFPSRMTIGMLIESIAGKAAAYDGVEVGAASFRKYRGLFGEQGNNEQDPYLLESTAGSDVPAHEYFGHALEKHGFHKLGTERMYSGLTGEMMETHIFVGLIYYQRLRHMVKDKAQVRATGPIDPITRQPVGGRSRHGGIRLGEMERDSLLAHGTAFLVRDRLLRCSDYYIDKVCRKCGWTISHVTKEEAFRAGKKTPDMSLCKACGTACEDLAIPYVFRYLSMELAAMSIQLKLVLS